jgi:hypothetical protein
MGYYSNAGTTSANFLGTTDRQPLVLKTNRSEVLRIDINGHVGIGTGHHKQILVGKWNDRNGLRGNLFRWDVRGWGQLVCPLKLFRIDHPLDPANKYLNHACVESPDLKTIYDGTVNLDLNGEAVVELPNWFEALNKDFRYQLTCIGGFAPVYIADEITGNRFKISGGNPGMRVCWQVTGVRDDPFARANPVAVEEDKPDDERGYYQNPEVHGQPEEMGIQRMRDEERRRRRPPHAGERTTANSNTD